MTNRFFIFSIAMVLMCVMSVVAHAQRCSTDYEIIFEMNDAQIGSYNVWDTAYGEKDTQERFKSGLPLPNNHIIVVGERDLPRSDDIELIFLQLERRGRVIQEQFHKPRHVQSIEKIVPHEEGFLVMGAKHAPKDRQSVWLGTFNKEGFLKAEKEIKAPGRDIIGEDIIQKRTGGYLISASVERGGSKHAIIYHINDKGGIISDRAYVPGLNNQIASLMPAGEDAYYAAGFMRGADGRKNGWILKLAEDGSIMWQQQYPRGRGATINKAGEFINDYVAVVGQAVPAGPGKNAAWVMMVDNNNGDVIWQRYYTGETHNDAVDFVPSPAGLISVLMQSSKLIDEKAQDFVRLLTINPRGVLFISDEYFNSEGARAFQLIETPGKERVIIGETDEVYQIEGPGLSDNIEFERSLEGWVVAAVAMEPYKDPCIQPYSFLP